MSRRSCLLVATPLLALALAACGNSVPAEDVAEGAEDALEAVAGERPVVSCPEDLEAEVGARTRCTVSVGDGQAYGVTVTVTSVEGDDTTYDVQVDEEPAG